MTTLTLTSIPGGVPCPSVAIVIGSIDVGVSTITLWRTVGKRQLQVRGFVGVSVAGGSFTGQDFEAPFDVVSTYQAQQFDSSGNFVSWSTPTTVTLAGPGGSIAWFHNPLDPSTAVQMIMGKDAGKSKVRPIDAQEFAVQGSSAPVTTFGVRGALKGVVLDCWALTGAQSDAFDQLFGLYDDQSTVPILCVRTPAAMRLPSPLFVLIPNPEEQPMSYILGNTYTGWLLTGDEVAAPATTIIVAVLAYADFTAFYADYAAFSAAYVDYQTAGVDYSIEGTA
jgi:hypothetical protein